MNKPEQYLLLKQLFDLLKPHLRKCTYCGETFVPWKRQEYCSAKCSQNKRNMRKAEALMASKFSIVKKHVVDEVDDVGKRHGGSVLQEYAQNTGGGAVGQGGRHRGADGKGQ